MSVGAQLLLTQERREDTKKITLPVFLFRTMGRRSIHQRGGKGQQPRQPQKQQHTHRRPRGHRALVPFTAHNSGRLAVHAFVMAIVLACLLCGLRLHYYPFTILVQQHDYVAPHRRSLRRTADRVKQSSLLEKTTTVTTEPQHARGQPQTHLEAAAAAATQSLEDVPVFQEYLSLQWRNPFNLVHVVQTRFMQHQPHLLHLGRARMKLFRTITLPSMKHQSNQSYLWMIRIDPNLDDKLREEFLDVLDEMPNLIVILSNQNMDDFRQNGLDDIESYGRQILARTTHDRWRRVQMLESYYEAAGGEYRIVLESRLDADDALAFDVIDMLQRDASLHLNPSADGDDYRVWCLGPHMEWQYYNPWDGNSTKGSLVGFPYGHCVTPGLTYGYQYSARANDVPTHQHMKLHKTLPSCDAKDTRCLTLLRRAEQAKPLALRARTPTSAGMANVFTSPEASKFKLMDKWSRLQRRAWSEVEVVFGITQASVVRMRQALETDLAMIAADNAAGQCTPGHSCKPGSRAILSRLQKQHNVSEA